VQPEHSCLAEVEEEEEEEEAGKAQGLQGSSWLGGSAKDSLLALTCSLHPQASPPSAGARDSSQQQEARSPHPPAACHLPPDAATCCLAALPQPAASSQQPAASSHQPPATSQLATLPCSLLPPRGQPAGRGKQEGRLPCPAQPPRSPPAAAAAPLAGRAAAGAGWRSRSPRCLTALSRSCPGYWWLLATPTHPWGPPHGLAPPTAAFCRARLSSSAPLSMLIPARVTARR